MTSTPRNAIEWTDIVFPEQANHYGTLFAGHALQSMAKAAFLVGRKFAERDVVVAGVSGAEFLSPIPVGHVLTLRAWVSRVGRSSLTVCVKGQAHAQGATPEDVLTAVFEMVAVDATGRPVPINTNNTERIDRSHLNQETTA